MGNKVVARSGQMLYYGCVLYDIYRAWGTCFFIFESEARYGIR